jgi:hypothetical protein
METGEGRHVGEDGDRKSPLPTLPNPAATMIYKT